jgi:hypothetical protein
VFEGNDGFVYVNAAAPFRNKTFDTSMFVRAETGFLKMNKLN